MRRLGIWFYLSCKRYMHRLSFLAVLLLLPLGTFLIRSSQGEEPVELRIAVCAETPEEESGLARRQEKDGPGEEGAGPARRQEKERQKKDGSGEEAPKEEEALERQLIEALVHRESSGGMFRFYECENQQQVKEEVAARRAECGYVIATGLRGRLNQRDFKRCIQVYSAPSTVAARLSAEPVFAAMIELYDRELFLQYMEEKQQILPGTDRETAGSLYDQWKENGSTFRFTYEPVDSRGETGRDAGQVSVFPVRGIVAVYIFVVGLYGAAISLRDEKKGLFFAVPFGSRFLCHLAALAAPVYMAALSGLAALWTGRCMGFAGYELAALLGYGAVVVLFSWGVGRICRREEIVCCLIPFFLAGSLIFCPVFLNIGKYVPEFEIVEKFFLPGYYMNIFR